MKYSIIANSPAQLPASVAVDRLRGYGKIMLATLDQLTAANARAPQMLRFRDWAVFGEANAARYLGFWLDEQRLYHLDLDALASKRFTDRLALVVRKPVFALRDPALGFMYVVQLKPRPVISAPVATRLPELVPLDLSSRPAGDLQIPLGVMADGPRWLDLADPVHVLIGGLTQQGKSSLEQAALISIGAVADPARVRIALVDPKGEFVHWYQSPHLFAPVAKDARGALNIVEALNAEAERRRALFESAVVRNIKAYNAGGREPLPYLVAIIDEFVDLAKMGSRKFLPLLISLASKAGSYGIRLIGSATSTKAEIIDTTLRQQFGIRIAFKCSEPGQSEAILGRGHPEAAALPATRGRFIVQLLGAETTLPGQGYYVSDEMLAAATTRINTRWGAQSAAAPAIALTADQKQLVLHALQHLNGYFKLRELSREFYGTQTPRKELRDMGNQWEQAGWLLPPANVNASRQIARVLRDAVGWVDQPK